jgi:prevent-host-death family protein
MAEILGEQHATGDSKGMPTDRKSIDRSQVCDRTGHMTTVSVSELKAHLSRYLREVRRGGEVQVLDRGRPVARLTSIGDASTAPQDEHRERLIQAGILRPGTAAAATVLGQAPLELPSDLRRAVDEDRDDRL